MVDFHVSRMDELIASVETQQLPPLDELRRTYEAISQHFNNQEIGGEFCGLSKAKQRHFDDLVEILTRAQAEGQLVPFDPALLAAAIQGATKELFGELALRPVENPFDTLTDTIFLLLIDNFRK